MFNEKEHDMIDFESLAIPENDYSIVVKDGKYGVIDKRDGKEVIATEFKEIEQVSNGVFIVEVTSIYEKIIEKGYLQEIFEKVQKEYSEWLHVLYKQFNKDEQYYLLYVKSKPVSQVYTSKEELMKDINNGTLRKIRARR